MSGSSRLLRLKRARLFARQGGLCYWCKQQMVLLNFAGQGKVKHRPPNMCTLDHLEPRWHPLRGKFPGHRRIVAACDKCNGERDRQQLAQIPRELVRLSASDGVRARELVKLHADALRQLFPVIEPPKERVFTFRPQEPAPLRVTIAEMLVPRT